MKLHELSPKELHLLCRSEFFMADNVKDLQIFITNRGFNGQNISASKAVNELVRCLNPFINEWYGEHLLRDFSDIHPTPIYFDAYNRGLYMNWEIIPKTDEYTQLHALGKYFEYQKPDWFELDTQDFKDKTGILITEDFLESQRKNQIFPAYFFTNGGRMVVPAQDGQLSKCVYLPFISFYGMSRNFIRGRKGATADIRFLEFLKEHTNIQEAQDILQFDDSEMRSVLLYRDLDELQKLYNAGFECKFQGKTQIEYVNECTFTLPKDTTVQLQDTLKGMEEHYAEVVPIYIKNRFNNVEVHYNEREQTIRKGTGLGSL